MIDVYGRLRERLDDFASGYPTTESGIEIKILKGLFTVIMLVGPNAINLTDIPRPFCFLGFPVESAKRGLRWLL